MSGKCIPSTSSDRVVFFPYTSICLSRIVLLQFLYVVLCPGSNLNDNSEEFVHRHNLCAVSLLRGTTVCCKISWWLSPALWSGRWLNVMSAIQRQEHLSSRSPFSILGLPNPCLNQSHGGLFQVIYRILSMYRSVQQKRDSKLIRSAWTMCVCMEEVTKTSDERRKVGASQQYMVLFIFIIPSVVTSSAKMYPKIPFSDSTTISMGGPPARRLVDHVRV